jgi:hypothetical protein
LKITVCVQKINGYVTGEGGRSAAGGVRAVLDEKKMMNGRPSRGLVHSNRNPPDI